jgi:MFS transporter, OFA family, oxalate/formate antiporter
LTSAPPPFNVRPDFIGGLTEDSFGSRQKIGRNAYHALRPFCIYGEKMALKRWLALTASIVMQTCLGMVYAWSTFAPALEREHQITPGRSGLVFGVCIASFTVSMVFGGQLQQKAGPRLTGMAGGLLFLTGYLTGSFAGDAFPVMLAGFGVLAGAGIGLAYVCPLATGIKWFPKQKGLITGLAVAGFGLGGIFFASAGQRMIENQMPVLSILRTIGWIVGIVAVCASALLFVPPSGGKNPILTEVHADSLKSILPMRRFRILFWQMFCGTFGGLLIIGNLKPIGMAEGLTAEAATRAVMLFAVGNASGRILWGHWYDRLGTGVITACMTLLAAGAILMGLSAEPRGFFAATVITAFAFGGCFVLFAARVADEFGFNRLSEIYPFVFLAYGIAGLAGPPAGGWMLARSGSPLLPCLAVLLLALGGLISSMRRNRGLQMNVKPAQ